MLVRPLQQDPSAITVEVNDGQVVLHGSVQYKGLVPAIARMSSTADGVLSVSERLSFDVDDTT